MEKARQVSFRARRTRVSRAAVLVVALLNVCAVLPAAAQSNTSLGTGALASDTTGSYDTALGYDALNANTTADGNTAIGANALEHNTGIGNTATGFGALGGYNTGYGNTADGWGALGSNTTAGANTATGRGALAVNTMGDHNTAVGDSALSSNTTGFSNTAIGAAALINTTGSNNVAVGMDAGGNLATGSNNIDIGNVGVAADTNTIRIGTKGTQTRTFIAGISGSSVFVGSPVLVNANGRLGVPVSSARYKRDIHDMGDVSDRLMKLRPVTFRYKEDPNGTLQYGLVAEEVAQVYPELVTYGEDGKPQSVGYHLLPAMLLNEMQKQVRENRRKDAQIAALRKQVESLQKETARIEVLTARLCGLEQRADKTWPERLTAAMR
jgi:hypothetical protein